MARVIVDAQAARAIGKGAMIVFKKGVVRTEGEFNPGGDVVEVYTRGGQVPREGFRQPPTPTS